MRKVLACLLAIAVFGLTGFVLTKSVSSKTPPGLNNRPPLEKIVFIHYKRGAKPPGVGVGKPEKQSKCYGFLSNGLKWKVLPVNYMIDPQNSDGLIESSVVSAINAGADEWDSHTDVGLFGGHSLIDDGSWDGWQGSVPDERNEFLFGDYPDDRVIAVTVIWGYFSVPPAYRQIIEFDVLFNNDYAWGDATDNPGVMDLQNIATHELGHGLGLDDVYDTVCSSVTMYGYSNYGETDKRTLEEPDKTGLLKLY